MAQIVPVGKAYMSSSIPNTKVKLNEPLTLRGEYAPGGWTKFNWFADGKYAGEQGTISANTSKVGVFQYTLRVYTDEAKYNSETSSAPYVETNLSYAVEVAEGEQADYTPDICSDNFVYSVEKDVCLGREPNQSVWDISLKERPAKKNCRADYIFSGGRCVYKKGEPGSAPTPTKPDVPTSITISVYTGSFTGEARNMGGETVAKVYTVNENFSPFINVGWYVNGERKSSGRMYNYFKSYAKDGDKIYAEIENTTVRSNTLVYNPSGADGAGGTTDIDGDGIPDAEDDDIDGDGVKNEDDDDIDGDGIENDQDPTPAGTNVSTYDTLYTRASQQQYLGDVFHADPTHTNTTPPPAEGFSLPTPLLLMAGLAGAYLIYTNSKKR